MTAAWPPSWMMAASPWPTLRKWMSSCWPERGLAKSESAMMRILVKFPPPHAAGMAPIFLLSFSKSEHAPVIPSERAARARDLLFVGEQSKGSAFHRSSAYLNSRSLATRAAARCARDDNVAAPFERETRRTVATLWYSTSHQYEFFPILLFDPAENFIPIPQHLNDVGLTCQMRRGEAPGMQLRERDPEHADQAIAIDQQSFTKRLLCSGSGRHGSSESSGLHSPSATRKRRLHARQIH